MTGRQSRSLWSALCASHLLLCACDDLDNIISQTTPLPNLDGGSDAAASQPASQDASTQSVDGAVSAQDAQLPRDAAGDPVRDASTGRDAGTSGNGDDLASLRQVCVDTINEHRATISLPPFSRATADQEACSDRGAAKDGAANMAHSSAGDCQGFGAQNTCPGWGFGARTGNATLADALKKCLQQMWDEGPPPGTVAACIDDYQNCFLKHGHYINMISTSSHVASCGFYDMGSDKFWMNQDFAR